MGDWPEFRMRSDDGRESSWTPYSNGQALSEFYQVGQRIEIDYVLQRHRLYSRTRGFDFKRHKIMIEVRIGTMPNKSRDRVKTPGLVKTSLPFDLWRILMK